MKIFFWSPTCGRCHTTSSLLALATNLSFVSGLKSCILSTNCSDNFQSALLGKDNEEALDSTVSTFGMDALLRDAKGAALTKNNIEDAAVDLSSKLSIFIPASSKDKKVIEKSLLHNHSVMGYSLVGNEEKWLTEKMMVLFILARMTLLQCM